MAEARRYVLEYEDGGSMTLALTSEQAAEYRKDPRVAKVSVEKSSSTDNDEKS
jgi:hypothetical protein